MGGRISQHGENFFGGGGSRSDDGSGMEGWEKGGF